MSTEAEAGPSCLPGNTSGNDPPQVAPEHSLPKTQYYSVEYPGYVRSTSTLQAIDRLGGQERLDHAFRRSSGAAPLKAEELVELQLQPGNPFAHPVPGQLVATNNIVLKTVKRKRKDGAREYTAEVVGVVPKTVRFRSMADFQYRPDANDPVTQLRLAMDQMNVEAIKSFRILLEKEDYLLPVNDNARMDVDNELSSQTQKVTNGDQTSDMIMRSNLRLFPPPLFSRQAIPHNYNFKPNPASIPVTITDEETGIEKTRMINSMRWKGLGPASISYRDKNVPQGPPASVEEMRKAVKVDIMQKLQQHFEERPIWTRNAISNQFSVAHAREIHNSKVLLPLVSYVFVDGPWRDTFVRFGYDPREEIEARYYQRLYFRNLNNPIVRASITSKRTGRATQSRQPNFSGDIERSRNHQFDGINVTGEVAAFQLCDLVDPFLQQLVKTEDELREECDERDGWYTSEGIEAIRKVLRHKFFSLLEGHIASDEECIRLLTPSEDTGRMVIPVHERRKRHGKHNLAKGALRPEDAAAERLRAQIEGKLKGKARIEPMDEDESES